MTQLNLINLKTFLFMKLGSLLSARCRHRSMKSSRMEGHTSLSTALVIIIGHVTVVEGVQPVHIISPLGSKFYHIL